MLGISQMKVRDIGSYRLSLMALVVSPNAIKPSKQK